MRWCSVISVDEGVVGLDVAVPCLAAAQDAEVLTAGRSEAECHSAQALDGVISKSPSTGSAEVSSAASVILAGEVSDLHLDGIFLA